MGYLCVNKIKQILGIVANVFDLVMFKNSPNQPPLTGGIKAISSFSDKTKSDSAYSLFTATNSDLMSFSFG
jgi:hypothetical protein